MILQAPVMLREKKYCLWLLLAVASCQLLRAQVSGITISPIADSAHIDYPVDTTPVSGANFTIRTIVIEGNKKTKPAIILREVPFKAGDSYPLGELVKKFETGRKRLMNLALFHEAIISLKRSEGYNVDILVQVKERWYLFPVPYFKPVDRNLNQWLIEQKGSLKRVNYGVKLLYNNATGFNDKLKMWLINGYTKQISFSYDRPYIDKQMKWGANTGISLGKNREINYNSVNDKQVFYRDENYIRKFFSVWSELSYRRAIKTRHRFGIGYTREDIADTVSKLNPDYFQSGRTRIEYPEIYYSMTYFDLDYNPYPTRGYAADISVSKKGLSKAFNLWQLSVKASANWPTGQKAFFSLNGFGTIRLPFKQPYYNQRLLGYSDVFLQGYEYYVIDGTAGGYIKASMTRKMFKFDIRIPGTKKLAPQRIPFNIYGRIYGNTGYIYNTYPGKNYLSNKMLFSTGVGLDIVSLYDFTLKLEWSFNQLGQNGLFLHRKSIF
jgi:outer membrane protein assembly factor BamA